MHSLTFNIIMITVLIAVNGFFSCVEFAIVSIRKSRVAQLADAGDRRAILVESLQKDPQRVLAVVQIGVTLVGSFASALGGIIAVEVVKPILMTSEIKILSEGAEAISLSMVVISVSYLSLVFGELVPKSIGLHHSETVALRFAGVITALSRIAAIAVSMLTISSKLALKLFNVKTAEQGFITRDEIRHIIAEGQESGHFTETEHEYIKNIFDFTHTNVREVMVSRTRMTMIDESLSSEEVLGIILETEYSRYPVFSGTPENVTGFIHSKDFLGRKISEPDFCLKSIIRPPFFVPGGKKVNELLEEMQRNRVHIAMVVDEYGGISGLVTTEDLIEELIGEIEDEHDAGEPQKVLHLEDGSMIVDALISMSDLTELLQTRPETDNDYDTLAGMILAKLGHLPLAGESVLWHGNKIVCTEVTKTSIRKVTISTV